MNESVHPNLETPHVKKLPAKLRDDILLKQESHRAFFWSVMEVLVASQHLGIRE